MAKTKGYRTWPGHVFVGILLLSGYNIRTSEKDYWSEAAD